MTSSLNHSPRLRIVLGSNSESNPCSHLRAREQSQFQCLGPKAIRHFDSESHLYLSLSVSIVHTFGHQAHAFGHQVHISGTNTPEKLQSTLSGTKCTLLGTKCTFQAPMPKAIHHFDSESQPPTLNCSLSRFRIKPLKPPQSQKARLVPMPKAIC